MFALKPSQEQKAALFQMVSQSVSNSREVGLKTDRHFHIYTSRDEYSVMNVILSSVKDLPSMIYVVK